jgi:hypothetical protein
MHSGRFVFSQLMDCLPKSDFNKCVVRYRGNHRVRTFSCYDQFLCMAFGQLTFRQSLRDLVTCLDALRPKLFHAGIRGMLSRSTLADANEKRDWRIYADLAQGLIAQAKVLYANEDLGIELENTVYALDSTVIDLCLSLFPWANYQQSKSAVRLHTLLNLRGNIPEFIHVSKAKLSEYAVFDMLLPEPGSFYVMDRGYLDFERLYHFEQARAFFVTRGKTSLKYARRYSRPVDKSTGLRCDQTITLSTAHSRRAYPPPMRRIVFRDQEKKKKLVFLTNNFTCSALTITQLYKARWQIELFFKWIKQHLQIKHFYGNSANAVKTQIWIAISVYVLVAIWRKQLGLRQSLYIILQILSVCLFEKTPILQAFSEDTEHDKRPRLSNQLELFDF